MNLLIITNNPDRASFRQRVGVYIDSLRCNGINPEVAKLPSSLSHRVKLFKKAAEFDCVFLQKKRPNLLDAILLRKYSKKIIYDFDDAIMYSDKNPQRYSRSHFAPFRRTVKIADLVIAGNAYLAEHARKFNSSVEILPTGLNTKAYNLPKSPGSDGKIRLVWIGSKSTLKYLAEIRPAIEGIGVQYKNVILRIIADEFIDMNNIMVEKCLWTKETEAADLAACDIGLAPLPDNRFTRGKCGFKILQYAAAGLPVVASPVGVNTEYIQQLKNGFVANFTSDWIDKICYLINDSQLRKQMGRKGLCEIRQYDLSVIGELLVGHIKCCIEKRQD
jgi:glycosyltransferase involved in cell wall biosynthesis